MVRFGVSTDLFKKWSGLLASYTGGIGEGTKVLLVNLRSRGFVLLG